MNEKWIKFMKKESRDRNCNCGGGEIADEDLTPNQIHKSKTGIRVKGEVRLHGKRSNRVIILPEDRYVYTATGSATNEVDDLVDLNGTSTSTEMTLTIRSLFSDIIRSLVSNSLPQIEVKAGDLEISSSDDARTTNEFSVNEVNENISITISQEKVSKLSEGNFKNKLSIIGNCFGISRFRNWHKMIKESDEVIVIMSDDGCFNVAEDYVYPTEIDDLHKAEAYFQKIYQNENTNSSKKQEKMKINTNSIKHNMKKIKGRKPVILKAFLGNKNNYLLKNLEENCDKNVDLNLLTIKNHKLDRNLPNSSAYKINKSSNENKLYLEGDKEQLNSNVGKFNESMVTSFSGLLNRNINLLNSNKKQKIRKMINTSNNRNCDDNILRNVTVFNEKEIIFISITILFKNLCRKLKKNQKNFDINLQIFKTIENYYKILFRKEIKLKMDSICLNNTFNINNSEQNEILIEKSKKLDELKKVKKNKEVSLIFPNVDDIKTLIIPCPFHQNETIPKNASSSVAQNKDICRLVKVKKKYCKILCFAKIHNLKVYYPKYIFKSSQNYFHYPIEMKFGSIWTFEKTKEKNDFLLKKKKRSNKKENYFPHLNTVINNVYLFLSPEKQIDYFLRNELIPLKFERKNNKNKLLLKKIKNKKFPFSDINVVITEYSLNIMTFFHSEIVFHNEEINFVQRIQATKHFQEELYSQNMTSLDNVTCIISINIMNPEIKNRRVHHKTKSNKNFLLQNYKPMLPLKNGNNFFKLNFFQRIGFHKLIPFQLKSLVNKKPKSELISNCNNCHKNKNKYMWKRFFAYDKMSYSDCITQSICPCLQKSNYINYKPCCNFFKYYFKTVKYNKGFEENCQRLNLSSDQNDIVENKDTLITLDDINSIENIPITSKSVVVNDIGVATTTAIEKEPTMKIRHLIDNSKENQPKIQVNETQSCLDKNYYNSLNDNITLLNINDENVIYVDYSEDNTYPCKQQKHLNQEINNILNTSDEVSDIELEYTKIPFNESPHNSLKHKDSLNMAAEIKVNKENYVHVSIAHDVPNQLWNVNEGITNNMKHDQNQSEGEHSNRITIQSSISSGHNRNVKNSKIVSFKSNDNAVLDANYIKNKTTENKVLNIQESNTSVKEILVLLSNKGNSKSVEIDIKYNKQNNKNMYNTKNETITCSDKETTDQKSIKSYKTYQNIINIDKINNEFDCNKENIIKLEESEYTILPRNISEHIYIQNYDKNDDTMWIDYSIKGISDNILSFPKCICKNLKETVSAIDHTRVISNQNECHCEPSLIEKNKKSKPFQSCYSKTFQHHNVERPSYKNESSNKLYGQLNCTNEQDNIQKLTTLIDSKCTKVYNNVNKVFNKGDRKMSRNSKKTNFSPKDGDKLNSLLCSSNNSSSLKCLKLNYENYINSKNVIYCCSNIKSTVHSVRTRLDYRLASPVACCRKCNHVVYPHCHFNKVDYVKPRERITKMPLHLNLLGKRKTITNTKTDSYLKTKSTSTDHRPKEEEHSQSFGIEMSSVKVNGTLKNHSDVNSTWLEYKSYDFTPLRNEINIVPSIIKKSDSSKTKQYKIIFSNLSESYVSDINLSESNRLSPKLNVAKINIVESAMSPVTVQYFMAKNPSLSSKNEYVDLKKQITKRSVSKGLNSKEAILSNDKEFSENIKNSLKNPSFSIQNEEVDLKNNNDISPVILVLNSSEEALSNENEINGHAETSVKGQSHSIKDENSAKDLPRSIKEENLTKGQSHSIRNEEVDFDNTIDKPTLISVLTLSEETRYDAKEFDEYMETSTED